MTTIGRLLTVATTFLLATLVGTSAALADAPVGSDWPEAPPRSMLDTLLIFGGGTIGLFVVVALFGLLTARNNYVPPPPGTDLATTSDDLASH